MNVEHVAILGLVAFIAYKLGTAKMPSATASQQANKAEAQADWWTYAGTWGG